PARQASIVHARPSGSHGVPSGAPRQSGGIPHNGHSSLAVTPRATTSAPAASKQSTGMRKASIVGVTATTSREIVMPDRRSDTVLPPLAAVFDGSQASAGGVVVAHPAGPAEVSASKPVPQMRTRSPRAGRCGHTASIRGGSLESVVATGAVATDPMTSAGVHAVVVQSSQKFPFAGTAGTPGSATSWPGAPA